MTQNNHKFSNRNDIDGLRGLSVIAVVLFHAWPLAVTGGFVGVDVFFVISGFLITTIIHKEMTMHKFSVSRFYIRRINRIFPALIIVMLMSLLLGWWSLLPDEFTALGKSIFGGAAFIPNIMLWTDVGNYFDVNSELKPLMHLWSLGVEEQFYFIWPLVLFLTFKFKKRMMAIVLSLAMISFLINVFFVSKEAMTVFYLPHYRAWELVAGGVLSIAQNDKSIKIKFFRECFQKYKVFILNIISAVGIFGLLFSFLVYNKGMAFPGWIALIPVFSTLAIIGAGQYSWINNKILSTTILKWIGLISYPLYLWHWPILSFVRIVNGQMHVSNISLLMCIALSFVFSILTYMFVERKVNRSSSSLSISLLVLMAFLAACGKLISNDVIKSASQSDSIVRVSSAINDFVWPWPDADVLTQGKEYFYKFKSDNEVAEVVLFFGDSHMQQYAPRISYLVHAQKDKTAIIAAKGGCPPIPNIHEIKTQKCDGFVNEVLRFAQNPAIKTVIISGHWNSIFTDKKRYILDSKSHKHFIQSDRRGSEIAINSLSDMIKSFKNMGKSVFLLLSIPTDENLDPRNMLRRSFLLFGGAEVVNQNGLNRNDFLSNFASIQNKIKLAALNAGAEVIDPINYLCDEKICPSIDANGDPIYKDGDHMRNSYVLRKVEYIDRFFIKPK